MARAARAGSTSSGTTSGALTFTGGNDSGGNPSTYYFYNPSGSGGTALDIAANANAAFGPATYYLVNGNLVIGGGATLTCPGCVISTTGGTGGLGDTFVLTGTGSGNTLTNNIGTVQIASAITTTLNAPGTGTYAGLLFFQDRNAGTFSFAGNSSNCSGNCSLFNGGSNMDMFGAIYMKYGAVGFQGGKANATGNGCLLLLDSETSFNGNAALNSDGCAGAGVGTVFTNYAVLTQ